MLISKTGFMTYLQCPYRYKLMFIDCVEWEVSVRMRVGGLFHKFAQRFFENVRPSLFEREDFDDWAREVALKQPKLVRKAVYNFLHLERKRYLKCRDNLQYPWYYYYPVATEIRLENPELGICGIIDRIDRGVDGNVLIEYKVSQGSLNRVRLRRELNFYVLVVNSRFNIKQIGCINPQTGEYYIEPINERSVNHTRRLIEKVQNGIREGKFEPRESLQCFYCPVKSYCTKTLNIANRCLKNDDLNC